MHQICYQYADVMHFLSHAIFILNFQKLVYGFLDSKNGELYTHCFAQYNPLGSMDYKTLFEPIKTVCAWNTLQTDHGLLGFQACILCLSPAATATATGHRQSKHA